MAKLTNLLAEEAADNTRAASAAAQGISMTGFSGRHTSTDAMFGGHAAPIAGERVQSIEAPRLGGVDDALANDPLFVSHRLNAVALESRQPFGAQEQQLAWAPEPGFRLYWFSDTPGRVARAKRAGYVHVIDPDTGEPACRITDKADGRGRSSYLMKIPSQWYQQDMATQAAQLGRRLDDIKSGRTGPGAEDNRYVPKQGITITGR